MYKKVFVEFLPGWKKWQELISLSACLVMKLHCARKGVEDHGLPYGYIDNPDTASWHVFDFPLDLLAQLIPYILFSLDFLSFMI